MNISLNDQEIKLLLSALDALVRSGGLQIAGLAANLAGKLTAPPAPNNPPPF